MGLNIALKAYLNVSIGMNGRQRLRTPMPEAISLEMFKMMCAFQVRYLLTRTPRDFVLATCLIGKSSRTKFGEFSNVHSLCHNPININSLLDSVKGQSVGHKPVTMNIDKILI